jgi:hypothetical protein
MDSERTGRLKSMFEYTLLTPILALKQGTCFSCWKASSQLKRCTACKRVSYCSQDCQKKDWGDGHRKTCKVLVASNNLRTATSPTGRTWPIFFDEKVYLGFGLYDLANNCPRSKKFRILDCRLRLPITVSRIWNDLSCESSQLSSSPFKNPWNFSQFL